MRISKICLTFASQNTLAMGFNFKKWNNYLGYFAFVIAAVVYLLTMERYLSFWDCGEYIVSSAKLGVTHAPGAALFQLIGAVWAGLAFGKGEYYAILINAESALFSALTIMLLFWTITHFVRRMFRVERINEKDEDISKVALGKSQVIITLGSGLVGAFAFMFSDTFWFSATEGEVYAMASLFTAIILWLGCKWDEEADEARADRWFILISFVIGLSIGVHLMAILAVPAVCYMYYARRHKLTIKSFIIANFITLFVLALVFKLIFPFLMTVFGKTETFVVNNLGLPIHSGTIVAGILVIAFFYALLHYTSKHKKALLNTITLCIMFMLIGFSCWMVIPIRANANPHMNLNDPDTALGVLDYFNREQYGSWPVMYGAAYTAHIASDGMAKEPTGEYKREVTGANYVKNEKIGKYVKVSDRFEYVYNEKYVQFFPKMFNQAPDVMENYAAMYGFPEFSLNVYFYNAPDDSQEERSYKKTYAEKEYSKLLQKKQEGSIQVSDLRKYADILNIEPPTFGQQLWYFIDYQIGYMGFRYFMWNFAGRQNDLEGQKDILKGNWISGIPFVDSARLGNQSMLPAEFKNTGTNKYFMLPLLLGLIGFFFQLNRNFTQWWAILSIFLLTSVGIIIYTSVKPFEPRERDYALVSSFFAFSIWIGLGVQGLYLILRKISKKEIKPALAIGITVLCLGVPALMGFQNWDDHDRSERSAAYDLSYNYLKGLDPHSILFVYGDNDTYPLWGLQETENFRDDVKIVNYTLSGASWYLEQVRRKTYNAEALPAQLKNSDTQLGTNDNVLIVADNIKNIFRELNATIKQSDTQQYNLGELTKLPVDELSKYLVDPRMDAQMIINTYNKFKALEKYIEKDSMTAKEAIEFILDKNSPEKKALVELYGYPEGVVNYLPISKIIVPVNKENALKYGIVSAKDKEEILDYLTINISTTSLYKSDLMMLDLFANYKWDRAIYFSGGAVSDPVNTFFTNDYLENNGLTYKLIPIYSQFGKGGRIGRSNTEVSYKNFNAYLWGGYNNPDASFSQTERNYTNAYRNIAIRLVEDLLTEGRKKEAKEVLDLIMDKIPDWSQYNIGYGLSRIARLYLELGEEKKASELFAYTENSINEKIRFFKSVPAEYKYAVVNQEHEAKSDLTFNLYNEVIAYKSKSDTVKAMRRFKEIYEPYKQEFINLFDTLAKKGANNMSPIEKNELASQYHFMNELLTIASEIDEAYTESEMNKIQKRVSNEQE